MGVIYYLGAPYTSPDPQIVSERVDAIDAFLSHALLAGADVFSPITYGHLMCLRFDLPRSWDFWKRFDLEMLRRANALLVLQLPGWDVSVGLGEEIEHAQEWEIPIEYIDPSKAHLWKPWDRHVYIDEECVMTEPASVFPPGHGPCADCSCVTKEGIGALYVCDDCIRNRRELRKGNTDE